MTELERPPKDSRGPVAERLESSPEIPETQTVALESVRRGDDDHSDDDDGDRNEGTQTVTSASMVAVRDDSEVARGSPFIRNRPHNEYDTGSAETDNLQNTDQTDPIASTNVRFSEQTLTLMTVSASSLPDVGEDGLAIVDISKLITVKVLDKRSSSSGVETLSAANLQRPLSPALPDQQPQVVLLKISISWKENASLNIWKAFLKAISAVSTFGGSITFSVIVQDIANPKRLNPNDPNAETPSRYDREEVRMFLAVSWVVFLGALAAATLVDHMFALYRISLGICERAAENGVLFHRTPNT